MSSSSFPSSRNNQPTYVPSSLVSKSTTSQSTVSAAAIQDNLIKSLGLGPKLRINHLPKRSRPTANATEPVVSRYGQAPPKPRRVRPLQQWTCLECNYVNDPPPPLPPPPAHPSPSHSPSLIFCNACGTTMHTPSPPSSSSTTSNTTTQSLTSQALTLSQILGITPPPPKPLNDTAWLNLESTTLLRGDCDGNCAICQETFLTTTGNANDSNQVILSCSHTFHYNCLLQFEKFIGLYGGNGQKKSCPVCRHEQYEFKRTNIANVVIRRKAVLVIQCSLRCAYSRGRLRELRRGFYRSGGGDHFTYPTSSAFQSINESIKFEQNRRRNFLSSEIKNVNDRIIKSLDSTDYDIDKLFSEFDSNLVLSRGVFGDRDGVSTSVSVPVPVPVPGIEISNGIASKTGYRDKWKSVYDTMVTRCQNNNDHIECPICLGSELLSEVVDKDKGKLEEVTQTLKIEATAIPPIKPKPKRKPKKLHNLPLKNPNNPWVLLSCTHTYHTNCLRSYEQFSVYEVKICAVCRSGGYDKIEI